MARISEARGAVKLKLSLIIPCYNEAGNIPLIIERLQSAVGGSKYKNDIEVILVDNGSTDNSFQVMSDEISRSGLTCFKIVKVSENQGYGYGILFGLNSAAGDVLAWTHADMQTDPKDVFTAYELYMNTKGSFIVKGKRKNRKLLDAFFTWGMQLYVKHVLNVRIDDINAQPKMFSRHFYLNYIKDSAPYDFSLDLYLLYQAVKNDHEIKTIPVYFKKRLYGEAKGGGGFKTKIKLIKRTILYIKKIAKSNNADS